MKLKVGDRVAFRSPKKQRKFGIISDSGTVEMTKADDPGVDYDYKVRTDDGHLLWFKVGELRREVPK